MVFAGKIISIARKLQFLVALSIYCFFALVPNPQAYVKIHYSDLFLHALGNLLLVLSTWLVIAGRNRPWIVLVVAVPFSLAVELAQGFTTQRTVDHRDMIANLVGIVIGFVVSLFLQKMYNAFLREQPSQTS